MPARKVWGNGEKMKREIGSLLIASLILSGCGSSSNDNKAKSGKSDFDEVTVEFFNRCEIDMSGYNHEGHAAKVSCKPKIIEGTPSAEQQRIIDEIYITTSKSQQLSNGEKIEYVFNDAEKTLNKLKNNNIEIVNESLPTEVKGLEDIYLSASEIPKEILSKVDKKMNDYMETHIEDIYDEDFWEGEHDINRVKNGYSLYKRILVSDKEKNDNRLVYIYKVSGSFFRDTSHIVHDPGLQIDRDVYICLFIDLFTSSFEEKTIEKKDDSTRTYSNEERNNVDSEEMIESIKKALVVKDYVVEFIE